MQASAIVVGSGSVGPDASADSRPSGTSVTPSVIFIAADAATAKRPPFTEERCFRTALISSIDAPQVTSNVELFMGSPRGFEIRRAPCGVHRLRLYTRSKQRFVLISVEPRVVCRDGSKQQIRLVMEPVARWGIAR